MNEQRSAHITGCNDHFHCASFGFFALFLLLVPYNKQLNNLDCSIVMGNSQTLAYRIDLAIAQSTWQGLSLRVFRNDLNLSYEVVIIQLMPVVYAYLVIHSNYRRKPP